MTDESQTAAYDEHSTPGNAAVPGSYEANRRAAVQVDEGIPYLTGRPDNNTCSWTSYSFLFGEEPCDKPGGVVVLHGCEHEHMVRSLTCDDCLPMVRRTMDTGRALCTPCRDRAGVDGVPMRVIRVEPLPSHNGGGADV